MLRLKTKRLYDFREMADELELIGSSDPYYRDIYYKLLNKLRDAAALQEKGLLTVEEHPKRELTFRD